MNQITKAKYLTDHYQDLQGYRLLPFAVAFLLIALNSTWVKQAQLTLSDGNLLQILTTTKFGPLLLIMTAFLASHLIGKAYETRFGRITPAAGPPQAFNRNTYALAATLYLAFELLFMQPAAGIQLTWLWLLIRELRPAGGLRHVPASSIYLLISLVIQATRQLNTDLQAFDYTPLIIWSLITAAATATAAMHNHRLLQSLRPTEEAKASV